MMESEGVYKSMIEGVAMCTNKACSLSHHKITFSIEKLSTDDDEMLLWEFNEHALSRCVIGGRI